MFDRLNTLVARLATLDLRREDGQAMAEYALVLALVAVIAAAALSGVADGITGKLGDVASSLGISG
jgi:Flp pilus assembly pilin Flp